MAIPAQGRPFNPTNPNDNTFVQNITDSWLKDTLPGQLAVGIHHAPEYTFGLNIPDPDYNVYRDENLDWYDGDLNELMDVRSPEDYRQFINIYNRNKELRDRLESNEAFWTRMLAQVGDPINWIPIPALKGQGLIKGGLKGGASVGAITALQEVPRTMIDPTDTLGESAAVIGFGSGLGILLGGVAGSIGRQFNDPLTNLQEIGHRIDQHFQNTPHQSVEQDARDLIGILEREGVQTKKISDFSFFLDRLKFIKDDLRADKAEAIARAAGDIDQIHVRSVSDFVGSARAEGTVTQGRVLAAIQHIGTDLAEGTVLYRGHSRGKPVANRNSRVVSWSTDFRVAAHRFAGSRGGVFPVAKIILPAGVRGIDIEDMANQGLVQNLGEAEVILPNGQLIPQKTETTKFADHTIELTTYKYVPHPDKQLDDVNTIEQKIQRTNQTAERIRAALQERERLNRRAERATQTIASAERRILELAERDKRTTPSEQRERIREEIKRQKQEIVNLRRLRQEIERDNLRVTENLTFGPNELGLKPLPLGLEKLLGKGTQMPWYNLVNNPFVGVNDELANLYQRTAWMLAASPDLIANGGVRGASVGPSVMMRQLRWLGIHHKLQKGHEEAFLIDIMGVEPGGLKSVALRGREALEDVAVLRRVIGDGRSGLPENYRPVTFKEYRELIGEYMVDPEGVAARFEGTEREHILRSVERRAEAIESTLHRPAFEQGQALDLFATTRVLETAIERHKKNIEFHQKELDEGTSPNPETSKGKIKFAEQEIEKLEGRLLDLKESTPPGRFFFHTMYDLEAIQANPDGLKEILKEHFLKGYEREIRRLTKLHTADSQTRMAEINEIVDAKVHETFLTIRREAEFGDFQLGVTTRNEIARLQARLQKLKEASDKGIDSIDGVTVTRSIAEVEKRLKSRLEGSGEFIDGAFLGRVLKIPRSELKDYIIKDVDRVVFDYARGVGSAIEMAKVFGDHDLSSVFAQAGDLFDAMDDATKAKMKPEFDRMRESIVNLRDSVRGTYGIPDDPMHWSVRTINTAKAYSTITHMGVALFSAWMDMGKIVMAQGMGRTIRMAKRAMQERGPDSVFALGTEEAHKAGVAGDFANLMRLQSITDQGMYRGFTKLERAVQEGSRFMFMANLLTTWTDHAKRFSSALSADLIIRRAIEWDQGTIKPDEKAQLASFGMTDKIAFNIRQQWQDMNARTGESGIAKRDVTQGEPFFLANSSEWADQQVADDFSAILATAVDASVLTPNAANRPLFMSKPLASMILQYMSFGIVATQSITMSALQKRDMQVFAGIASMVTLAWIIDAWQRPDYIDMDLDEAILRAVERSGVTGIMLDLNNKLEIASNNQYGLRPLLGMDSFIENPDPARRVGSIAGPAPSQWGSLAWSWMSPDATNDDRARAMRYVFPYNNLLWWQGFFDGAQRETEDVLDVLNPEN